MKHTSEAAATLPRLVLASIWVACRPLHIANIIVGIHAVVARAILLLPLHYSSLLSVTRPPAGYTAAVLCKSRAPCYHRCYYHGKSTLLAAGCDESTT